MRERVENSLCVPVNGFCWEERVFVFGDSPIFLGGCPLNKIIGGQCLLTPTSAAYDFDQDRLYFHQALWSFIYFTHFSYKNVYFKKNSRPSSSILMMAP